ncbi:MAG TPA: UDP-N-acetylmuramoyl-L-alanine--D-glutamate ligase [bacterium]|nr:UDP-N-acetylmuramoyl-L-alanine--D-glutamate ligase [bacterium]
MLVLKGKRVAVLGLMDAGVAAIRFLAAQGAKVQAYGVATENDLKRIRAELKTVSYELFVESPTRQALESQDYVILTSGGYHYHEVTDPLRAAGKTFLTDLELASHFYTRPIIAITGSNGKSTTIHLVKAFLEAGGKKVLTAGGDHVDFAQSLCEKTPYDYVLLELSSARLRETERFRPHIAVFLNLYPGHSDRHDSMRSYGLAKSKIFSGQGEDDFLVHQASHEIQEIIREVGSKAKALRFSVYEELEVGIFYRSRGNSLRFRDGKGNESKYRLERFSFPGPHNIENLAAAVLVAKICGIPDEIIRKTIETVAPLPDRVELITKIGGVAYYSDARSSNAIATLKSLQTFPDGKVILIAGGEYMEHQLYWMLKDTIAKKAKALVVFGMNREHFRKHWEGSTQILMSENLETAVEIANRLAEKGDIVLFSPAARPEPAVHMTVKKRSLVFRQAVEKNAELSKVRAYFPTRI